MAQPQRGADADTSGRPNAAPLTNEGEGDGAKGVPEGARSFVEGRPEAAAPSLDLGAEATLEGARAGLEEAVEELAGDSRWATQRSTEFWRASFDPLLNIHAEAMKLFEHFWLQGPKFFGMPGALAVRPMAGFSFASIFGSPTADLKENGDAYTLRVELPGLAKEDLTLTIRGDTLAVAAEKRKDQAAGAGVPRTTDGRSDWFDRSFVLPRNVDRSRIAAEVRNGVLDVTLPKAAEMRTPIPIA